MMASKSWQQPCRRHRCLGKRQQELDSHLDFHRCPTICCTTSSNAGGTICDSDVWNARICLELCGCTAQYSSDTSSGTEGTSGIVDFYATWQMNQDSPAGLQYRRLGTSLEANFQGIT